MHDSVREDEFGWELCRRKRSHALGMHTDRMSYACSWAYVAVECLHAAAKVTPGACELAMSSSIQRPEVFGAHVSAMCKARVCPTLWLTAVHIRLPPMEAHIVSRVRRPLVHTRLAA